MKSKELLEFNTEFVTGAYNEYMPNVVFTIGEIELNGDCNNRISKSFSISDKTTAELYFELYNYAFKLINENVSSQKYINHGPYAGMRGSKCFGAIPFPFYYKQELIPVFFDFEETENDITLFKFIN